MVQAVAAHGRPKPRTDLPGGKKTAGWHQGDPGQLLHDARQNLMQTVRYEMCTTGLVWMDGDWCFIMGATAWKRMYRPPPHHLYTHRLMPSQTEDWTREHFL